MPFINPTLQVSVPGCHCPSTEPVFRYLVRITLLLNLFTVHN